MFSAEAKSHKLVHYYTFNFCLFPLKTLNIEREYMANFVVLEMLDNNIISCAVTITYKTWKV